MSLNPTGRRLSRLTADACDGLSGSALALALALALGACAGSENSDGSASEEVTAVVGATLVTGTDQPPIADGVLLLQSGRILTVGPSGTAVPSGARVVDAAGSTIVPGLINAHGHVGGTSGLETDHYTRENLIRQLELYAAYGVTTVVSLGGDAEEGIQLRDEQDMPGLGRARLFVAGEVVAGETAEEAVEAVQRNVEMGVDLIKIRVDDNLGSTPKMSEDVYTAVIDAAHEAGLPLAAHLFYLEDAKGLLGAGADLLAHSIRDQGVDPELIEGLLESGVCYVPTLTRELSTFVYGDEPPFFDDPFFLKHADREAMAGLTDPERQAAVRDNPASSAYEAALEVAIANLGALSDAGVPIALGTDTGPPGRFQGYFEHVEMRMMSDAGMSPPDILRAATSGAASCMGLPEVGTLEAGQWADFLIVDGDPLEDIANLQNIRSVWIAGAEVEDS